MRRRLSRLFGLLFRFRRGSLLLLGAGPASSGGGGGSAPNFGAEIGNQTAGSSGTAVITTTGAVAQGKIICVAFGYGTSGGATVSGVTDSRGNTYSLAATSASGAARAQLYIATATTALQVGDSITVGQSGSSPRAALAFWIDTSTLDVTQNAQGSGTAVDTGATGTPTAANELVLCVCAYSAGSSFTQGAGYTKTASSPIGSSQFLAVEWKQISSATAQNGTGTIGGTPTAWGALVATFK